MKKLFLAFLIAFMKISLVFTQFDINYQLNEDFTFNKTRKNITIPNIPGYITLKGDFHIHSIFSDGEVWPATRVEEAWREGLDVISITDHIEYRPHKKYLKANHNSSFEAAKKKAREKNILLIRGTEITKNKVPPGHFNALFLTDANLIENEDVSVSIESAVKQGAFIIWNHPGWKRQQPDSTKWWEFYSELQRKNMLHGIEVANSNEWYPVALDWCIDKKLTVFGNSDIHVPINLKYDFSNPYNHRPMTLVFAKERSKEGVKDALFEGNTIAWFGNILAGKEDLLESLITESLKLTPAYTQKTKSEKVYNYAELKNISDIPYILGSTENEENKIKIPPQSSVIVMYKEGSSKLVYIVENAFSGANRNIEISFDL